MIENLLNQGYKFRRIEKQTLADETEQVTLTLESPAGEANHGYGPTINEAIISAMSRMIVKLDRYVEDTEWRIIHRQGSIDPIKYA